MDNRLNGIADFVLAAEAGSFALAAGRLGMSRSAIGKSIARLEERLGVRLFHRTTRSQSLTEAGQIYYERCVRALAELEAAETALADGQRAPVGRLRMSVPVLFGRVCVAPLMRELAARHDGLELEISFNDRVVDLVEEGIDLAVRMGPLPDSTGLRARRLGAIAMVVCASPVYLARRGVPATAEELIRHDAITYGRGGSGRYVSWRFPDTAGQAREAPVRGRLRFDDLEAIADAAVAGAGLAWLPCWLVSERIRAGALVKVLPQATPLTFDAYAVWPQSRHLPSKVRAAIDELAARVPGLLSEIIAQEELAAASRANRTGRSPAVSA